MGLTYVDSCLLIYLIEQHPIFSPPVRAELERDPTARYAISPLVKLECLVAPLKRSDLVLQRAYETLFGRFLLLSMPEEVFLQAARLRAQFGLRTPDALHLATAQHHHCAALWTNDDRMTQVSHGLVRRVL